MSNIDQLKQSISEIPRREAIEVLLDVRQARREAMESKKKKKSKSKRTSKKSKKNKKKDLIKIVEGLSSEDAKLLMENLRDV